MPRATAVRILVLALLGGILVDIVVPGNAPGIGIAGLTVALLAAAVSIAGRTGVARMDRADLWLAPSALLLAAFIAVRSEPWLVAADVALAGAASCAAILALGGARITRGLLPAILSASLDGITAALVGAGAVLAAARPPRGAAMPPAAAMRLGAGSLAPVARGLAISLPLAAIFVALFASADAVFASIARTVIDWRPDLDLAMLVQRTVIITGVAWATAGTLAVGAGLGPRLFSQEGESEPLWADGEPEPDPSPDAPPAPPFGTARAPWASPQSPSPMTLPRLGSLEATTVLTVLAALFAVFVALQVAYLFGGRDTISAAGITYSDYARRGFFELVAVAIIAGVVAVGLELAVRRRSRAQLVASIVLLALTGVVLASALARLRLYQEAYGWTELRFVVLIAIGWLGAAITVTAALIARQQTRWLLHALGVITIVAVAAVNLVGPAGFVAEQNLARIVNPSLVPSDGRAGLDADYLDALGDGAIAPTVAALRALPAPDRVAVERYLTRRVDRLAHDPAVQGWPAWNLDRQRARDALAVWRSGSAGS